MSLFGRTHDLVAGLSGNRDFTSYYIDEAYNFVVPDPADLQEPDGPGPSALDAPYWGKYRRHQVGIYAAGRFSLTDAMKLIAGGRLTWFESEDNYDWQGGWSGYSVDAEPIPYVGIVYDVNPTATLYASYTGIFRPLAEVSPSGGTLDPAEGTNLEAGVKASLAGGRLEANAAIFESNLDGLPEEVFDQPCPPALLSCYEAAERIRTRGVELDLVGALTDRWILMASYSCARPDMPRASGRASASIPPTTRSTSASSPPPMTCPAASRD